jgi:hypothetical protein
LLVDRDLSLEAASEAPPLSWRPDLVHAAGLALGAFIVEMVRAFFWLDMSAAGSVLHGLGAALVFGCAAILTNHAARWVMQN